MSELEKEVEIALSMIEMLGEVLASGVAVSRAELTNTVTNGILGIFPEIVDVYIDLDEQEYKEETEYWVQQMERALNAVEGDDHFFLMDVLCYETKENLINFKESAICKESNWSKYDK